MTEYAIKFDYDWWIVVQKPPIGEAIEVGRYRDMTEAMRQIQSFTGAPVILKVLCV